MTFTGTLIEDLMAAVERVETSAQSKAVYSSQPRLVEPLAIQTVLAQPILVEPWFASAQDNTDHDAQFLGVA